jgi:hypothetical protein
MITSSTKQAKNGQTHDEATISKLNSCNTSAILSTSIPWPAPTNNVRSEGEEGSVLLINFQMGEVLKSHCSLISERKGVLKKNVLLFSIITTKTKLEYPRERHGQI